MRRTPSLQMNASCYQLRATGCKVWEFAQVTRNILQSSHKPKPSPSFWMLGVGWRYQCHSRCCTRLRNAQLNCWSTLAISQLALQVIHLCWSNNKRYSNKGALKGVSELCCAPMVLAITLHFTPSKASFVARHVDLPDHLGTRHAKSTLRAYNYSKELILTLPVA